MSVYQSMTALADQVRRLSGQTVPLGIDAMTDELSKIVLPDGTFEGPYTVTPKVDTQTLATAGKRMGDDVTIKAIPLWEVSNQQDGITLVIGGEI